MKRMTIKDLAKMLSLSTSTISRALSDHPDISDVTKTRVKEAASQFNYTTNMHARLFRKQSSGLIALVLPEINMFFHPQLIEGVNEVLANTDYSLITFFTNDLCKREAEIIEQCLAWSVEGVMISLSSETTSLNHFSPFIDTNIACVLLDRTIENEYFSSIKMDGKSASYKAVSYLIEKGHSNILGIFDNQNLSITQDRIQGYKQALIDKGLPVLPENIIASNRGVELDFVLPPILKHNKKITALFTMSDALLAKSYFQIQSIGLSIPKDISIVSISDGFFPQMIYPKVTHVRDAGSKMGTQACQLLLNLMKEKEGKHLQNLLLSGSLVELDSVILKGE